MLDKYRKTEHYQERFGSFAIEKGFISQGDLSMAQAINTHEEAENGIYRHLGDILFFQGIMSANQVEEVVKVVLSGKDNWSYVNNLGSSPD